MVFLRVCVAACVFLPSPMGSKSSVASPSSSAAAVAAGGEAGFSREERAALQWVLERKEREPTKVCVRCLPVVGC